MEFLTTHEEVSMARVTQERTVTPASLASAVDALMPQLTTDLIALTRIPSISCAR